MGVIAVVQLVIGNGARAAGAFRDVLAGHFEMHAAGVSGFRLMHREEALDLLHNALIGPGLVARAGLDGVAVHRITAPEHVAALLLHRADQRRQVIKHLVGAEAADQREAPGFVLRVELIDQLDQSIGRQRGAAFQADGILHAAEIFHMRMIRLARAVADPQHMA